MLMAVESSRGPRGGDSAGLSHPAPPDPRGSGRRAPGGDRSGPWLSRSPRVLSRGDIQGEPSGNCL